jgi:hypothetical protein
LDQIGLTTRLTRAVELITNGRIALRTEGKEAQGRKDFHRGLQDTIKTFDDILKQGDIFMMLLCEDFFLAKELESATTREGKAVSSYETALVEYDDAFTCLELVNDPDKYKIAAASYSHKKPFRQHGQPKDGFIVAMLGHPARLRNSMKVLGIDPDEQTLRELRIQVCKKALELYMEKQEAALG